jgi:histidine triad (HIT) family protein
MICMEDSIFTKIIKGEIPSHKIYEDERSFVILDIYPIQPGQVLVVPKKQVGFVWDLEDEDYQAVMATAKKVAGRLREVFPDKQRIAMHIEGLDIVDHAHVKVFPFSTDEEFRHVPNKDTEPDHAALAAIAEKLKF